MVMVCADLLPIKVSLLDGIGFLPFRGDPDRERGVVIVLFCL